MGITAQDESIDPGAGVVGSNELLSVLHPRISQVVGNPLTNGDLVDLGKTTPGMPGPSINRGITNRKKSDVILSAGGTNLAVNYIGELSAISHESPPRGGDDAAESDTSSVASSLEKLHEDFSLLPEQWYDFLGDHISSSNQSRIIVSELFSKQLDSLHRPGKVCAFCNLGERSMLGQGDLLRLEIPEGFDPVAVSSGLTVKGKLEKDVNSEKSLKPGFSCRRQKGAGKMKRLMSQNSLESINEPVEEVCGYSENQEFSCIFDSTSGYFYVHQGCANWCEGVTQKDDSSFINLESELIRSLSQRCLHCGNLGAGVICKAPHCGVIFHFPCAAISGAFQDPCSKSVLCSSHLDLAVSMVGDKANCTVCDSPGKISSLIMCSSCGHHYHGSCMALNCDPGIRAGWQCPACKMCQACRQPGDESKLLSCDTCDKSYHIFCLRPALSSIPKHSWKCKLCRMCTDCGARTPGSGPSSRWHANFSVCDSCYQQRNKGLACPMCGKAYRHVAQKLMLQCHICKKYVHGTCDPAANLATYQQRKDMHPDYEYVCVPCKSHPTGQSAPGGAPRIVTSTKRTSDELGSDDNSILNNNTSSQDTLFSPENDSVQSTENSSDIIWAEKNLAPSDDKHHQLHHHHHTPKDNKLLNHEAKLHKRKSVGGGGRVKGADRIGQHSTNTNRRHSKVTDLVKKRGPKPKLRMFGSGRVHRASTDSFPKEGEEQVGVENRMILCSARDDFVLQQDVCVMCGAYGNDLEGRLIACAQCGQCYHPYCVTVKVNRVILTKGWRCLDCTVCEGCGQRNDEARLLLCDECDVSFHIYCMDPPLDSVPHGTWKCKWCVVCQFCGSNDPGKNSIWHNNYTTCGPCASFTTCPKCKLDYTDGELIIKCSKCDRWIHAGCDSIKDDDDAEKCSDENYSCVLCRPSDVLPPHLRPPPPPIVTKVENPPKSPDLSRSTSQYNVDGVCLSDTGMSHIKSLTMDFPRKKRKKMPNIADMEAGILAAIESVVSGGDEKIKVDRPCEDDTEKDKEAKKRQRSLQKLGIGGFVVRLRGPRFKDDDDMSLDQLVESGGDKPKRKAQRRKIKNKLVENFPVYLQEAFFGKSLLEPGSKETDLVSTDELEESTPSIKTESTIKLSKEEIKEIEAIKAKQKSPEKVKADNRPTAAQGAQHSVSEVTKEVRKLQPPIVDDSEMALQDILTGDLLDNDFMDNIMNDGDDIKVEEGLVDFRPGAEDSNDFSLDQNNEDVNPKDEFNDILTSQFGLENIDSGLPSMDSKDVEDIFNGVLIEESSDTLFPQVNSVPPVTEVGPSSRVNSNPQMPPSSLTVSSPSSVIPPNITTTGPVQASPGLPRATQLQQNLASPVNFPPPSPYPSEYSNSPQFSPAFSEPPSPWPAQTEVDSDQPSSYNQRSNMQKWEADEALGPNATISCVLYANINHPELKRDYTSWSERAKQISKIWRSLSSEKKAPYLQKARENRAASRMQKAQQLSVEICV
ncbi:Histone-lysine N-methyltransferase 2C, partial [Orchesella cincta]